MRKILLVSCAAVFTLGLAASSASAGCVAGQPKDVIFAPAKANKFQSTLIQAMVSCTLPDTATGGGTPACTTIAPISDRFQWCTGGNGSIKLKAGSGKLGGPLNGPPSEGDLFVQVKLKGVCWGASGDTPGQPVGDKVVPVPITFQTVARPTLEDRTFGPLQIIDFPAPFAIVPGLIGGKAKLKSSANALLNGLGIEGLTECSVLEPVDLAILDDTGAVFARPGTYMGKGN